MNTLADICITYDIAAMSQYKVYEKELVSIFKNGDYLAEFDESSSCPDSTLYHFCGLYHYHVLDDKDRAIEYYELAAANGNPESYNNIGAIWEDDAIYGKALLYYHKALDAGVHDAECIYNLANIYDEVEGERDTAKTYYHQTLELGYWDAAGCLANIYDQYDEDYDNAVKYYLIAIEHGDDEAFIHLMNLIYDVNTSLGKNVARKRGDINAIIQHAKTHPEQVRELYNVHKIAPSDMPPTLSDAWHDIIRSLGLEKPDLQAMNYMALKRKTQGKLATCDICMSDGELECIPVNWCMHYVCVSCYAMVWNKHCPFCRLDAPPPHA